MSPNRTMPMAEAKEPPLWAPMFSLPNVHVKFPIDVDGFALVAPDDFRIKAIKKQQPRQGSFLKKFKTEFGDPVQPSTIIFPAASITGPVSRSEEHTSELQSHSDLVC